MSTKKKICMIVQRYGSEVNGGAEQHCRMLAEKMTRFYDVTVLTTKALDYMSWADEYEKDEEVINGVKVKRFSVKSPREKSVFDAINLKFHTGLLKESEEQLWIDRQGPYVPNMISYIKENKNEYETFIFFTYLYYPTVMGVPHVADKSIVLTLAHDEPFLRMKIFENVFLKPRAFFFNTEEERKLVRKKFKNYHIPYMIGGVGIDLPKEVDDLKFKKKYGLDDYIVYVGRIDDGKNCNEMFEYFKRFKAENKSNLKLVLMGKKVIEVPKDKDIIDLGFVDEEDKFAGIQGAKFLWLPSKYESLSMVVLESFGLKKPVIVNGECEVLKAHCALSGGGFYYKTYEDFKYKAKKILENEELAKKMGINGKKYLDKTYNWELICRKLKFLIEEIVN